MGALVRSLGPGATCRPMCLCHAPRSPCGGRDIECWGFSLLVGGGGVYRVVLLLLPLSALWNRVWSRQIHWALLTQGAAWAVSFLLGH